MPHTPPQERELEKLFKTMQLDVAMSHNLSSAYLPKLKNTTLALLNRIIDELESNPNEDGSQSPNLQHWIERKKSQIKRKFNLS